MTAVSFKGGVHPRYEKDRTAGLATRPLPPPAEIVIPLAQHIGAPARACVAVGDDVRMGQVLGEPAGFVSVPVHASVSGKVTAIEPRPGPAGTDVPSVVIENDGQERSIETEGLGDAWESASPDEIRNRVRAAGLVGMGGAAFPTHVKLSPPANKPVDTVIINGAECEPYLTADHRLMLERPDDVVAGLRIAMRVLGASRGLVAIEENKPDALESIGRAARAAGLDTARLRVKYPQGAEKQLIDACLGRRVPSGGLPMDVGVVVQNAGTAAAIADAVIRGRPLFERIVTVTGDGIPDPANLLTRVGTPVSEAIAACGGIRGDLGKLILGGPMMGLSQHSDRVPVVKGTSGILVLPASAVVVDEPGPCIRCGRCVESCPMRLVPRDIAVCSARDMMDRAEEAGALDCIECGSCAFECPSRIALVQHIRLAKAAIALARRKAK